MRRSPLLAAVAAMALASISMPALPRAVPQDSRRDPYEPDTRYRRRQDGLSPAQRLLEKQRQKRAKATGGAHQ